MRHIAAAISSTYTGNLNSYKKLSLKRHEDGLVEKYCFGYITGLSLIWGSLLDSLIRLRNRQLENSVVLMSYGNHQIARGTGRLGINNATFLKMHYKERICKILINMNSSHIYWVSTHYRLKGYFQDETPERVEDFNVQMRDFFESGSCAPKIGYIDVYNMTKELSFLFPKEAVKMSPDQVHWGREVNMNKAQIILNAVLKETIEI